MKLTTISSLALAFEIPAVVAGPKYPRHSGMGIRSTSNWNASRVSLHILTETGTRNATSPDLYGWMFEDINHSGEGGLYGELLTNRAFDGSNIAWDTIDGFSGEFITYQENPSVPAGPVLTGYKAVGGTRIRLDTLHPLTPSHKTVLGVDIPTIPNATAVGFENLGWWGIPVIPQTYNVSFYVYPDQVKNGANASTAITVSLQSNTTGEIFASTVVPARAWNPVNWTYVKVPLVCDKTAPDSNNTFVVTFDPIITAGQTYYFDQISLFGETFQGYKNGLRKDLAEVIYDLKPKFLRWPGGNNIEGYSIQERWKWWETIGSQIDRVPRMGNWEYYNTNGLGLLEFLEWTESMEMENVLAIYSGYSLGDDTELDADTFPSTDSAMYPVLQEALNELEFCMGSTDTYWGAKRAEYGHPEPFKIKYVEIGNEDFFSANYPFRFKYLYDGLIAAYPDIIYISTAYDENADYTIDIPAGAMWDTHYYEDPAFFISGFNFYDNWQESTNNTNVTVFIGEYSVFQVDTPSGVDNYSDPVGIHIFYPEMQSAIAEGVYLLGAERNPNTVKMSSYAPSLQNFNWYNWTPNLVAFNANPLDTVASVSYYMQKMFNAYHGTESVEVTNSEGDFGPLYWAAATDGDTVLLKVINTNATEVTLSVDLESTWTRVNGTIITNPNPASFNYKNNATALSPRPLNLTSTSPGENNTWDWDVPGYSITVLQFDA